jgi:hypothetical protein
MVLCCIPKNKFNLKEERGFMRKAEFLARLQAAVNRIRGGIPPHSYRDKVQFEGIALAKEHAVESGIFIEDPEHASDKDNPVVLAIDWYGKMRPPEGLSLERIAQMKAPEQAVIDAMVTIERAWEYFDGKSQTQSTPPSTPPSESNVRNSSLPSPRARLVMTEKQK